MDNLQKVEVQIISAFVDNSKGGNPAGVVINADNLSNDQKLKVASKVGLSETAFVSKSRVADFKLDFFTPTRQIAHCGHATIATFSYLSQLGLVENSVSSKETIDGTREISIQGDLAFMEQKPPVYTEIKDHKDLILSSLGLTEDDMLPNAPLLIVNTGNSFAIVPVANDDTLKNVIPNFDLIKKVSEELDLIGFYVFSNQSYDLERDANTRMFAPRYGIQEEAGTGMAAGPLACYLFDILGLKRSLFNSTRLVYEPAFDKFNYSGFSFKQWENYKDYGRWKRNTNDFDDNGSHLSNFLQHRLYIRRQRLTRA